MTEYNEGDRVRAEKNSTVIEGTLWGCEELFVGLSRRTVAHLLTDGFTITVIEKAAPVVVLPGEYGAYKDDEGDLWQLNDYGWKLLTSDPPDAFKPENYVPFTRLEPVSETAKKVLKALNDFAHPVTSQTFPGRVIYNDGWDAVAADFGVEL